MRFYLGTHLPEWLGRTAVPLMVSHTRLKGWVKLPRALGPWALDSGGFTQVSVFGKWTTTPQQYVKAVQRYSDEIGNLNWAAPMDWMCEPFVIAKTGLSVKEHQRRTVANFIKLRTLAPELPIIPVLQGWQLDDYFRCIDMYDKAGIDVSAEPLVGIGSVCRRQHLDEIRDIFTALDDCGVTCHGFGVKMLGLQQYSKHLRSADSMAWSYNARMNHPLPGHELRHRHCSSCLDWALRWRGRLLDHVA